MDAQSTCSLFCKKTWLAKSSKLLYCIKEGGYDRSLHAVLSHSRRGLLICDLLTGSRSLRALFMASSLSFDHLPLPKACTSHVLSLARFIRKLPSSGGVAVAPSLKFVRSSRNWHWQSKQALNWYLINFQTHNFTPIFIRGSGRQTEWSFLFKSFWTARVKARKTCGWLC